MCFLNYVKILFFDWFDSSLRQVFLILEVSVGPTEPNDRVFGYIKGKLIEQAPKLDVLSAGVGFAV